MLVGAMNHPARDLRQEIAGFAQLGMDFVDLTLEPPAAATWKVDPDEIRALLAEHRLAVMGHTAYYLSIGSPFERIRKAAVQELSEAVKCFARIGVPWMNIHPDGHSPFHPAGFASRRNLESLRDLSRVASDRGIGLMVENVPGRFNSASQLGEILDEMPELGLHLDIGHCNLMVRENTADEVLTHYGDRVRHVHLHDNRGGTADLHLPLGAGTLDYPRYLRILKQSGYDGTITLEVFTGNPADLVASSRVLRQLWGELEKNPAHDATPAAAR